MTPILSIAGLSLRLGRVDRATFHPDGLRPESDTDHTVMLGLLAIDIAGEHPELGLNLGRLALLALVHDLAEAYAGDTNTAVALTAEQRSSKAAREAAAVERIAAELGDSAVVTGLRVYEEQELPEARFLRYLDKVTPKLTHTLNGNIAIRRMGWTVEQLRERHRTQGAELAAAYPEFVDVLGPIFDAACAASEEALARAYADAWAAGDTTVLGGAP